MLSVGDDADLKVRFTQIDVSFNKCTFLDLQCKNRNFAKTCVHPSKSSTDLCSIRPRNYHVLWVYSIHLFHQN